jgi:hypothetical protein
MQIVHDEDPASPGVGLNRVMDVLHEIFFRARHANGRCDHLALHDIPITDQAERPMSLVFEFDSPHLAGPHRDGFGNPLQRLNARHPSMAAKASKDCRQRRRRQRPTCFRLRPISSAIVVLKQPVKAAKITLARRANRFGAVVERRIV